MPSRVPLRCHAPPRAGTMANLAFDIRARSQAISDRRILRSKWKTAVEKSHHRYSRRPGRPCRRCAACLRRHRDRVRSPRGGGDGRARRRAGTREEALLRPESMVETVDGFALSGGSALGLDAAGGVQAWLAE